GGDRCAAVFDSKDGVASLLEELGDQFPVHIRIFGDEDLQRARGFTEMTGPETSGLRFRHGRHRGRWFFRSKMLIRPANWRGLHRAGDFKPKTRPSARTIFSADAAAPALDSNLAEVEAQTRFAGAVLSFCEKCEQTVRGRIFREAGAFVVHECEQAVNLVLNAHRDSRPLRCVTHGVFEEVPEDALEARSVSNDFPAVRCIEARVELQSNAFFDEGRR